MDKRIVTVAGIGTVLLAAVLAAFYFLLPTPGATSTASNTEVGDPAAQDKALMVRDYDRVMGSPTAPITMIEYASLTCGHCAAFHIQTIPRIKTEYIEKGLVRWVFREYPLDRVAAAASLVARCLPTDGYFPFVDLLYQNQPDWAHVDDPREGLITISRRAGLSREQVESCLKNTMELERMQALMEEAGAVFGVNSTPTLVINGKVYRGAMPFDQIDAIFKELLAGQN